MFGYDLEQLPYEEQNLADFKIPNPTAFTMKHGESTKSPTNFKISPFFPQMLQNSLDQDIYVNNALFIKKAIIAYLQNCLLESTNIHYISQQNVIFRIQADHDIFKSDEQNAVESLINSNGLLTPGQKQNLLKNISQFEEISGIFSQINKIFAKQFAREIIYVFADLLQLKMKDYKNMINSKNTSLLPKIERLYGEEDNQTFFKGSWEVYQQIDYDQVRKFASQKIEEHSLKLYFSGRLNFLTLRQVKFGIKEEVSVVDKFATLMIHLSRNMFLNISGISQSEEDLSEVSNELGFNLINNIVTEQLHKKIKTDL